MMDWTDRHCRCLHRQLTRHALLYTEMVTADAILHGDRERLLGFDAASIRWRCSSAAPSRRSWREAARIGADFGYDEINLNVGCPSDRVQSGRFGACLMREPELVAECVAAMRAAVSIPVTVKCRIGVDDQDPERVAARADRRSAPRAGVTMFAVHARKAWLEGLSPKENRDVPPLDYDLVYRIKREHPEAHDRAQWRHRDAGRGAKRIWRHVDGVMLGRAAYHSPAMLADVDARFFGGAPVSLDAAVDAYVDYVAAQLEQRVPLSR